MINYQITQGDKVYVKQFKSSEECYTWIVNTLDLSKMVSYHVVGKKKETAKEVKGE